MKDICGTTGLACTRCNPGACEHRYYNMEKMIKMFKNNKVFIPTGELPRLKGMILAYKVDRLNEWAVKNKLTIRGMSGEKLIITDQVTGEEYVVEDLGYPF